MSRRSTKATNNDSTVSSTSQNSASIDYHHSSRPAKKQRISKSGLQDIVIDPLIDSFLPPVVTATERLLTDLEVDRCKLITEGDSPESFVKEISGRHRLTLD